jgi:hypothetical protein
MLPPFGIKKVSLQAYSALTRFPIAMLCGVLAFALLSVRNHFFAGPESLYYASNFTRLALTAIAGIPLFFAFHIFCESNRLDTAKKIGFTLLGGCLLGLHFYSIPPDYYNFELNYTLRYINLLLCLHLWIAVIVYNREATIYAFWQYNKSLFINFITCLAFSATLYLGIGGALYAINKLFNAHISSQYYLDVLFFCELVFNLALFLYNIPDEKEVWESKINYSNALRIFIQYICIPIIALYAIILGVYLISVLVQSRLPQRAIATPTLVFCAISVFTYLLAYPVKDGQYFWIRVFCKYIFYVLLPYLVFELLAVAGRVKEFALTENRYLALMLGLWLVAICIYMILSRVKNITYIPMSLGLVLAIASLPKVGMYSVSAATQKARLMNVLSENNLLKDGKVNLASKNALPLTEKERTQILASLRYLYTRSELSLLHPLLNAKDKATLERLAKEGYDASNFGSLFGVEEVSIVASTDNGESEQITFVVQNPELNNTPIKLNGGNQLLQFEATDYALNELESPIINTDLAQAFVNDNKLQIVQKGDTLFNQSLDGMAILLSDYIEAKLNDSSFFGSIGNLTLPYTTHYYSRDSLAYRNNLFTVYFDEVRLIKSGITPRISYARGYTIF